MRHTKAWLIAATALVIVGCLIFVGVMMTIHWDFSKLSEDKYEMNTYEIAEEFENIFISTDTADILFVLSEGLQTEVHCRELKNMKHRVTVEDGTLRIAVEDTRKWYEHISLFSGKVSLTLYLPEQTYEALHLKTDTGDVQIPADFTFRSMDVSASTGDLLVGASARETLRLRTSTGDILVGQITAGAMDLQVSTGTLRLEKVDCRGDISMTISTGKTELTDILCRNLTATGTTGDITLENVLAEGKLSVERSTGSVKLANCDAAELYLRTSTGDVEGSLRTQKIFLTRTSTGSVHTPQSLTGGKCEIITGTGDISITVS